MLTKEEILALGFHELPHFTISDSLIYDLPRNRHLSIGDVGTPNEMLSIAGTDPYDSEKVTDVVVLSNYDFDGYVTKEKVEGFIKLLEPEA